MAVTILDILKHYLRHPLLRILTLKTDKRDKKSPHPGSSLFLCTKLQLQFEKQACFSTLFQSLGVRIHLLVYYLHTFKAPYVISSDMPFMNESLVCVRFNCFFSAWHCYFTDTEFFSVKKLALGEL